MQTLFTVNQAMRLWHGFGATLEAARANLTEAVELILEANRTLAEETILAKEVIREKMLLPAA